MTTSNGKQLGQMVLTPILLLVVWEGVVRLRVVDAIYLPPPSQVFVGFYELIISGELWTHVRASMTRVFSGYLLAALLGIGLGLLLGWFRSLAAFFEPLIELFRPISAIALIPLAILWFGIGETSKIFLIMYGTFFPILLNTIAGVRNTERVFIRAARTLGAGRARILLTVVIPSAVPFIYTGLRISMGIAMIVIISSEMVAADNGLGWFILDSERVYKTDLMVAGIITISVLSLAIDFGLRRLRGLLFPWWRDTTG
jgi:ABC-type nitrate/sulfonate/bicarbonate transport system permease component